LPELPEPVDDSFELWWDAQLAWQVFMDIACPWKISMDGIAGIDDVALVTVIKLHPVQRTDRLELFRDVQAAVRGALKYINEQREKTANK
jgi:hypothetical protein